MNPPLRMSFDLACSAEHAFSVWTSGLGTGWPPDHTVTGQADLVIVLQSGVGGRIYERTSDGVEYDSTNRRRGPGEGTLRRRVDGRWAGRVSTGRDPRAGR